MNQISVVFFTEEVFNETIGGLVIGKVTKVVRHKVATGKTSLPEAFDVAVAHGADPMKHMEFIFG